MLQLVPLGQSLAHRQVQSLQPRRLAPRRSPPLKHLELVSDAWARHVMGKALSVTMA
jgi:hypothetical protein